MARVFIGIGSNIGDRKANCLSAVDKMAKLGISVRQVSPLYETEPWGLKDQPGFINAVTEADTDHCPRKLLTTLKQIEAEMGRREALKWGPRVIDLDILLYGDKVVQEEGLRIPHPLLHLRDFVLTPLCDIAPGVVHPELCKTVSVLKEELKHDQDFKRKEQGQD